jgi:hypothetical protein
MPAYLPDTNVLIDFDRDSAVRTKLENAQKSGSVFRIGPPALIELVRGMIAGGCNTFRDDKEVFIWLRAQGCPVLELPRPFMARILRTSPQNRSGVKPDHYLQLIEMIVVSADFGDFMRRSDTAGSVWRDIARADEIHRAELDKELGALETIAKRGRGQDLATKLSQTFGMPGCRPNPLILKRKFSAAIEFLEASLSKVRGGAKPRKNDRGLYLDFQLLLYLADPEIAFLTEEDFSSEIRTSPQTSQIIKLDSMR